MPLRAYRIGIFLLFAFTLLFTTLHLRSDFSVLSYISSTATRSDFGRNITLAAEPSGSESRLWNYVDAHHEQEEEDDPWVWVAKQRRRGYRRPSWGGLTQQGPRAHVRDNLKREERYITTFTEAGFNNEVMEVANIMALALRTQRIPIVPPFLPSHGHLNSFTVAYLSASEVLDFTDFVEYYGVPVIDSLELKVGQEVGIPIQNRHRSVIYDGEHPQTIVVEGKKKKLRVGDVIQAAEPEIDEIQYWNTFLAVVDGRGGYVGTLWPAIFEDTPLPRYAYANLSTFWQNAISLPRTAETIANYSKVGDALPAESVSRLVELDMPPSTMQPDDPLGCIHHAYSLHLQPEDQDIHDDWRGGVGAWAEAGKFMKFQPGLIRLAEDLLRFSFGLKVGDDIPPYMAVHIRRTDFGIHYNSSQHQYAHQAWTLLREVQLEKDYGVRHIVFASDEQDQAWLKPLKDLGWIHIDHSAAQTGDRLDWCATLSQTIIPPSPLSQYVDSSLVNRFPTIVDSIILSSAKIFLGVPSSTMSILPCRRVLDWNGGACRYVQHPDWYQVPPDWEWSDPFEGIERTDEDSGISVI